MKQIFAVRIPHINKSKLFIASVLFNAGGAGLVMAFLLFYFDKTAAIGLAAIGAAITLGRAAAMIVPLLIGRLLDAAGPRRVAIIGDFITGLGFCLCYLAADWPMIALSQFFIQAGAHMFWTSNRGMVGLAARGEKTQTWFGLIGALRNAGLGAGTVISALVFSYNSVNIFHFAVLAAGALYFASCVALYFWRPAEERLSAAGDDEEIAATKPYRAIFKDKKYMGLLVLNSGMVVSGMVIPLVLVIYVSGQLGLPAVFAGFLVVLNTALVAFLGVPISSWTENIAPQRNIRNAYILNIIAFLLFWAAGFTGQNLSFTALILLIAMLIYTGAEMLAMPPLNVLSVTLAPAKGNGNYMGLFQMTWSVGMTLTPALFGWLLSEGEDFIWPALLLLVSAFGLAGFYFFGKERGSV